jgi:hypothetical protein
VCAILPEHSGEAIRSGPVKLGAGTRRQLSQTSRDGVAGHKLIYQPQGSGWTIRGFYHARQDWTLVHSSMRIISTTLFCFMLCATHASAQSPVSEYVCYHHEDRTHLVLDKETPNGRARSVAHGRVIGGPRLGGLHHLYDRAA